MSDIKTMKTKAELQARQKAIKERDAQLVRGKFTFHDVPGGTLKFPFKDHGNPLKIYTLVDGEITSLPLSVAQHLNNNCWSPGYAHDNVSGLYDAYKMVRKVHRTSFTPLEFKEIEGLGPQSQLFTPSEQRVAPEREVKLQL
jgi:hypothetical protein